MRPAEEDASPGEEVEREPGSRILIDKEEAGLRVGSSDDGAGAGASVRCPVEISRCACADKGRATGAGAKAGALMDEERREAGREEADGWDAGGGVASDSESSRASSRLFCA